MRTQILVRKVSRYIKREADGASLRLHNATKLTKVCWVNGVRIQLEASNQRELSRIMSYATKEPGTIAWIDNYIKPGDVLYDIGANIGQYSLYPALKWGGNIRVYSFEPESQNYAALNRNIHINDLSDNVVSFCLAVSDSTHIASFNIRGHLRAGEAIHQFGSTVDDVGATFSPIHRQGMMGVSLDDLHFRYHLDFPNAIKIDVDGLESDVIRGGTEVISDPRLRSVLIEITEVPARKEEADFIYETFEKSGFTVADKVPTRLRDPTYPSYNVIFLRGRNLSGLSHEN